MTQHILDRLFAILESRKDADSEISYVAKLYKQGVAKCAQKFGEEAVELIAAEDLPARVGVVDADAGDGVG
ncbi:MAG: phosphoribosyl-ATP diphosphatase, partial [Micavibrio aeruginosavorus]